MVVFHQWARLSKGVANFTMAVIIASVVILFFVLIYIAKTNNGSSTHESETNVLSSTYDTNCSFTQTDSVTTTDEETAIRFSNGKITDSTYRGIRVIKDDEKKRAEQAKLLKLSPEERKYNRALEKAREIFCDQPPYYNDYSHLTPEQAERKLENMKERDGWVEDYDYIPLSRIARGEYPIMEIPAEILEQGPKAVQDWFNQKKISRETFNHATFKEIGKILKAHHEEVLLKDMETVNSESIEEWVSSMKSQGYFFSIKAYNKARKIYMSAYPKPKPTANGDVAPKPKRSRKKPADMQTEETDS